MFKFLAELFMPASDVAKEQLKHAERRALVHQAQAELHVALAAMYEDRADRLRDKVSHQVPIPFPPIDEP